MRSTKSSRCFPGVVVTAHCVLALLAAPAPAAAQPRKPGRAVFAPPKPLSATLTGQAKADYDGGVLLYQDGDHATALQKFQHAYDVSKDPRLLWNVAACE